MRPAVQGGSNGPCGAGSGMGAVLRRNVFMTQCTFWGFQISVNISLSKQALGIAGVQTTCFPWSSVTPGSKAQVDLVIERKDGIADL